MMGGSLVALEEFVYKRLELHRCILILTLAWNCKCDHNRVRLLAHVLAFYGTAGFINACITSEFI